MGLKTIPFRDIEEQSGNMYEAVVAMSGQAKSELQERLLKKAIQEHHEDDPDVFDEVEELTPETYEEQEKVTTTAIEKFLNGDVNWRKHSIE